MAHHIELLLAMEWRCCQLLEAETLCMLFHDNAALCSEVSERVIQHFVRCIETHGRHMQYLRFLQTVVKSENTYIRKCQDMVMTEVRQWHNSRKMSTKLLNMGSPSQSYRASPAIWDHTVLPATRHRWMHSISTQARQARTWFTYHEGMEGFCWPFEMVALRNGGPELQRVPVKAVAWKPNSIMPTFTETSLWGKSWTQIIKVVDTNGDKSWNREVSVKVANTNHESRGHKPCLLYTSDAADE